MVSMREASKRNCRQQSHPFCVAGISTCWFEQEDFPHLADQDFLFGQRVQPLFETQNRLPTGPLNIRRLRTEPVSRPWSDAETKGHGDPRTRSTVVGRVARGCCSAHPTGCSSGAMPMWTPWCAWPRRSARFAPRLWKVGRGRASRRRGGWEMVARWHQLIELAGWLVGWLAGWLVGWLAGWLAGWLVGWLVG